MYDALYGRQSIDKKDSISVESQIEYCQYETHGNPYKVYIDRGFSGKNTNRPGFEQLMIDLKAGIIRRVIVYKLDRISRSILDFSNMMETFQAYHVEFVSSTEKFDTSTPIGRAMLNICIVFAQLERETIQKRVADSYYARSKRGFYMGGRIPYGFSRKETVIDGIKSSMFEPVPEECEQIQLLYSLYANPVNSLGDIVCHLQKQNIKQLRSGIWSTARISDLLRNPIYVKANADVYEFFRDQGASIVSPIAEFTGCHACYLYQGITSTTRKQSDLIGKELVLAPHEGVVSATDWLACRVRCLNHRCSTKTCKPKKSWLLGKVKCGGCGYGLTIAQSNTKWNRYFICGTKSGTRDVVCSGTGGTIYADVLETYLFQSIKNKLAEFQTLTAQDPIAEQPQNNDFKIRIAQLDHEINLLITKVNDASPTLMQYIEKRVADLDLLRKQLNASLLSQNNTTSHDQSIISNHAALWEHVSFDDKQAIVDFMIQVIHISGGTITITWKI